MRVVLRVVRAIVLGWTGGQMEDESHRMKVASVFSSMHTSVVGASARMLLELKRYNYVTPTNFLELVKV